MFRATSKAAEGGQTLMIISTESVSSSNVLREGTELALWIVLSLRPSLTQVADTPFAMRLSRTVTPIWPGCNIPTLIEAAPHQLEKKARVQDRRTLVSKNDCSIMAAKGVVRRISLHPAYSTQLAAKELKATPLLPWRIEFLSCPGVK
tara:strand:- start:84 stop:527 length:444 start_codon:yes stop_codon:yes gene_type:complete